ncbi:MAG: methionine gamma-lyase family protein [Clostridia bacterium]|nr:methionine gamma-lyase family protein [Clostridia bacterium]
MDGLEIIAKRAEENLTVGFERIDRIAYINTERVLAAFKKHRVSEGHFASSTGYGYDDRGREVIDRIYAELFGCEAALVRHNIVNGTHALAIGLYGLLRPGDTLLSVAGKPYDTLEEVIGISGTPGNGSLADFGIGYRQVELKNGKLDFDAIGKRLDGSVKVVFVQRSKGYLDRPTLSVDAIGELVSFVKERSDAYVMVDNCYGEFTETKEPSALGADLVVGSLIKNPGGGMAECGGYLCGTAKAVELCSYRLTTVGVGGEVGATVGQNKNILKGLFYAPHSVKEALKTALFAAKVFEELGFEAEPDSSAVRHDIIQSIRLCDPDLLCAFCRGIQYASPVDSYVTPEPWDMPGYQDKVIMAAGTFTSGSSIELSADGPLRSPYTVFFQGGLTYESGKVGILSAAREVLKAQKKRAE